MSILPTPPITDYRSPPIAIVIGLPPSLILPLSFFNGHWIFVIGYSRLSSLFFFPPPITDYRLPITDHRSPITAPLFPAAASAAINSQAVLERGHQFSSCA